MKKFLLMLALLCIFFSYTVKASTPKPPEVSADGAILMDAKSLQILYSKNIDTSYPPASTTKIMTALLTFEKCNLDDLVTVGKNPPLADGSKIYIHVGEKLTVEQLLHGLLLSSANDCAETLAEYMAGSKENFAKMMNQRAKELGCTNTNFVNPSGLYNKEHKTSAKDLALIMNELVKHEEYIKIAKTSSYKIPKTNKMSEERPLWNGNRLIQSCSGYYYKYCEGGKTGYTVQSLHSYVASAKKDGHRLIVALVHDGHKTFFKDAPLLFNYGFDNFESLKLYSKGDTIDNYEINDNSKIPININEDFYYSFLKNQYQKDKTKVELKIEDLENKTIKKGTVIGKCLITYDNKTIGMAEVTAGSNYTPKEILGINMNFAKTKSKNSLYTYLLFALGILFISIISMRIIRKRKAKKNS
ncbi:D-alanyl-D-alanine carboxypeptidase family protein [Haloimpatiens sp. FM7315]|uniref:D-alanyl-D-alanine carboxypeptidase family protein n=1 Tax=Haloimpatiens sp. FM7315 TaxID=3298609 RepID=UPI003977DDA6